MKVFKSFDEFVNESTVNEATADKFKIKEDKPNANAGEIAAFKVVLRELDPQASMPQLVANSAVAKPEFKKFADDTTLIAFMLIKKERDPGFLTPRDLLRGSIIFKKAEGYDKTKAQPIATVGSFSIYDAMSAESMKAADKQTAEEIKKDIEEIKKDPVLEPKPEEKSGNPEYVDVEKIEADADVIAYLKSKLLNGESVKFSKGSTKIVEIKATQTLITKFKRADKKTECAASIKVRNSGIDGIYGNGTADGLGFLTKEGTPQNSITSDLIIDIAKWCKLNGLDKAAVKKIFDETKLDETKPTPTPAPAGEVKYYFVNKGWTYTPEADPYKN
jgi:hypothetical protein